MITCDRCKSQINHCPYKERIFGKHLCTECRDKYFILTRAFIETNANIISLMELRQQKRGEQKHG